MKMDEVGWPSDYIWDTADEDSQSRVAGDPPWSADSLGPQLCSQLSDFAHVTAVPWVRVFIVRQGEPLSGCQDGLEKDASLLWEGSKHLKMLITGTHLLSLLLKKLRHEDHKFEANLGSIARPRLSKSRGLERWLSWSSCLVSVRT